MMSSSLSGQTKGKESCSFIEPVFTTVILTYGIKWIAFHTQGRVFFKAAKRWLSVSRSA